MELQRHNSPPPQCGSARRAFTGKFNEVFCKVKYAPFLGDKFLFVYPEGSISAKNICSCDRPVLRLKTIYLAVLYSK